MMRLYHFSRECHGLASIRDRRLKISTIDQLNDPFEALSIELSNKSLRRRFNQARSTFSRKYGLLCLSRVWSNALMWSHYADRHRGICLGFDVPQDNLIKVKYKAERMVDRNDELVIDGTNAEHVIKECLGVKYASWKYEQEVRRIEPLREQNRNTDGLYFAPFGEDLRLIEVIIGDRLKNSRSRIKDALGDLSATIINSRLAFKSFRVVRQKEKSLWS